MKTPPPVPSTAIFSRSDGIVAWQGCREREGPTIGEHRGRRQPLRPRPQPGGALCDRRPARAARRRLAALRCTGSRADLSRSVSGTGHARTRAPLRPPRHELTALTEPTMKQLGGLDASFSTWRRRRRRCTSRPQHHRAAAWIQGQLLRRLQGPHRGPAASVPGAAQEDRPGAVGHRPPALGPRRRHRPRLPRSPCGCPSPARSSSSRRWRPAALHPARSEPAALGVLRHRGAGRQPPGLYTKVHHAAVDGGRHGAHQHDVRRDAGAAPDRAGGAEGSGGERGARRARPARPPTRTCSASMSALLQKIPDVLKAIASVAAPVISGVARLRGQGTAEPGLAPKTIAQHVDHEPAVVRRPLAVAGRCEGDRQA